MLLLQMFHDTAVVVLHQVMTVLADPPKPGEVELPPEASQKFSKLLGWGKALVYVACTAGFFVSAGKMALAWQRGDDAPWGRLAAVAGACIIGGGATGLVDALF
jgi:hypothetical protein